jgi:tetratricopeptide (TPR) repeat protein
VILAVIAVAVYARTLRADFVNWDDPIHVYDNPRVIEPGGLLRSWSDGSDPGPYPILYTAYWLEWRLAGGAPWLFHLDNVLLHAANAVLLGLLVRGLGVPLAASWLVAALWALHPAHVESVAWVTERKNVLYVFLWLAALLLHLRPGRMAYASSLLLFAGALLCKGAAMTLPAAIVLVDWARGRRLDRRFWLSLLPYVVLGVAGGIGLLLGVPAPVKPPDAASRLALAARAFWFYVGSFFWPSGLVPIYARWPLGLGMHEALALLTIGATVVAAIILRARLPRLVVLGAGLFVTNVVLVLGLVWSTHQRFAFVADRFLYLPGIGLALAAVVAVRELARWGRLPDRVSNVALALSGCVLGILTWRQIPIWHDSETLWRYTLAHNPACFACHLNLGLLFAERGQIEAAGAHYEQALRLELDAKATLGLGKVRAAQGRLAEAAALYEQTLSLDPVDAKAQYNFGNLRRRQGGLEEAIARYREAIRLAPRWADAHNNLGVALLDAGRLDEAEAELEEALRLSPHDPKPEINLGAIAGRRNDWPAAIAHYEAALRGTPTGDPSSGAVRRKLAEALAALAAAHAEAGRFEEALRAARRALAETPADSPLAVALRERLLLYEARGR